MSGSDTQCKTCRFFEKNNYYNMGDCRRHAPIREVHRGDVFALTNQEPSSYWPGVREDDYCGDYEENNDGG